MAGHHRFRECAGPLLRAALKRRASRERTLGRGAGFWLAEPGRATSSRFVEQAWAYGWQCETVVIERQWPAVVGSATVRVHLFEPR